MSIRVIDSFSGAYEFLSNFYPASVKLDGEVYPTVEHAYQAAKTINPTWRRVIQETHSPSNAKHIGRSSPMREGWNAMRLGVMLDLLRQKFDHTLLTPMLLATRNAKLVEGNTWRDTYWGVYRGIGDNHLGRLLMQVREEIRASM